jgi:glycyl-tRNA synthetase (class II)
MEKPSSGFCFADSGEASKVYEPICLCAHCADDYRKARLDVVAETGNQSKGQCEVCKRPFGMAYLIKRSDTVPRCPRCGKALVKTETMTATFFSCGCGYEVHEIRD